MIALTRHFLLLTFDTAGFPRTVTLNQTLHGSADKLIEVHGKFITGKSARSYFGGIIVLFLGSLVVLPVLHYLYWVDQFFKCWMSKPMLISQVNLTLAS